MISGERVAYSVGLVAASAAAVGTLVVGGDLEVTLLMVTAVVAGLLCFDTSMERRLASFGPWVWLSVAPAMKTVPTVWYELTPEGNALYERYDHAGSLLFGICVLISALLLSRPSPQLGRRVALFDRTLVIGTGAAAAIAGASVAFRNDPDFGSATVARLLETPTWFVAGALLISVMLAAAHAQHASLALTGVLITSGGAAALLAITVAGREPDRGWWALLFAGLAWSSVGLGSGALGIRNDRTRASNAGAIAAVLVAVIAAAAAIAARSDRSAWGPGWILLGLLAVGMSALAMASRPPVELDADVALSDAARAAAAKERALKSMRSAVVSRSGEFAPGEVVPSPGALSSFSDQVHGTIEAAPERDAMAVFFEEAAPPETISSAPAHPNLPQHGAPETISSAPAHPNLPQHGAPETPQRVDPPAATRVPDAPHVAPQPAATRVPAPPHVAPQPIEAQPAAATAPVDAGRAVPTASASTAQLPGTEAVGRAAAALAAEPDSLQRHSLTPLTHAHHFDPSTGLLSATGLQHFITRAFEGPRRAGEVTIMLFTVRDLDDIEQRHGRLASAAITREIAERIRIEMPNGTGARFGRAAYAVLFVGDLGDPTATVQRLARTLLALRAPVEGGSLGATTDVVAGMAQCYETEDAAQFITRANLGLARAVKTAEPTFVAMP